MLSRAWRGRVSSGERAGKRPLWRSPPQGVAKLRKCDGPYGWAFQKTSVRRCQTDSPNGPLGIVDGRVEVFELGGVRGEFFEGFAGGAGREAGVDEFSEGALEIFGVFEMGGGVGDADLPFEVGQSEGDFIDSTVGFGEGGFGDGFGDLALGEFAADALGAEQTEVAAALGVGFGEALVVEQAGLFETGEDGGDFGGVFGAGFELLFEFGDGG